MPKAKLTIWALTILVSIPALFVGLHDDDFVQRLALSGTIPIYQRDAFSLYEFQLGGEATRALVGAGYLPWFTDPDLTVRFFRPISSALLALDVRLFGDFVFPAQIHSLAWFLLALALAVRIHRLILSEREAFFASLAFALAGAHGGSTTWLASRHVLVGGTFALLAWLVSLSLRSRASGVLSRLPTGVASLVPGFALAVGLLASESALTVVPLFLAELWFGGRAERREKVLHALPVITVVLAHLLAYRVLRFGTFHMGSYVSPFEAPGAFLVALFERIPLLLAEMVTSLPVFIYHHGVGPTRALWVLGVGTMLLLSWAALRRHDEHGADIRWVPFAVVVSLVPLAGAVLSGRVLLVPMVASSLMVGRVLTRAASDEKARFSRFVSRAGVVTLFVLQLGLGPLARVGLALGSVRISRLETTLVERSQVACPEGSRILVVNASDPAIAMYSGALFASWGKERFKGWHILSMAPQDLELARIDEETFELRTLGPRRTNVFESLYRPEPLREGQRVVTESLTATVLQASPNGPTATRFDVHEGAGPSCLVRARTEESVLESFELAPGGVVRITHEPGLLGI